MTGLITLAISPLFSTVWVSALFSLPKVWVLWFGTIFADKTRETPLDTAIAVGLGVCVVSTAFPSNPVRSALGGYNDLSYGLLAMVLYTLIFYWGATTNHPKRYLALAGYVALVVALLAVFEKYEIFPIRMVKLPDGRAVSTIGQPVHLGTYLAASLPLVPGWGVILMLLGIVASGSRGAVVAVLVMATCTDKIPKEFRVITVAVGILLGGAIITTREPSNSDKIRKMAWSQAFDNIRTYPVMGVGLDNFNKKVDAGHRHENAHNDLLQAAATTGIPGLIAYCFLWFMVFKHARTGTAIAIFVAAKFSPLSVEAVCLLAAVTGLSLERGETFKRKVPISILPVALFTFLMIADHHSKGKDYRRALVMAPWERGYLIKHLKHMEALRGH